MVKKKMEDEKDKKIIGRKRMSVSEEEVRSANKNEGDRWKHG